MKKLLVSLVLASSALVATAPASAQYHGNRPHDSWQGERFTRNNWFGQRLDRINYAIQRGMERGAITPREAQQLRREHQNLWRVGQRYYSTNGLDRRERADLERRLDRLQQRLRFERRDDDRRHRR